MTGCRDDALDATQEILVKVLPGCPPSIVKPPSSTDVSSQLLVRREVRA